MTEVYIYGLICPLTEKIMYVGKSGDVRLRLREHISSAKNEDKSARGVWIRQLLDNYLLPTVNIIETCDQAGWQERERHWIAHHRSVNPDLKNGSPGGGRLHCDRMKYIQILLPESMIKYIKAQPTSASAFIRLAVKEYIETSAHPPAQLLPDPSAMEAKDARS